MLLWWAPPFESQVALAITVTLAFMLSDTLQTLVGVPFYALIPEIVKDYDERTSLTGYTASLSFSKNGGDWQEILWRELAAAGEGSAGMDKERIQVGLVQDWLTGMRGGTLGLADLRGKTVLIGFFATWAPPSRMAVPEMAQLVAKYRSQGLEVVGIAVQDERSRVAKFLAEVPANFPILLCDTVAEKAWFGEEAVKVPVFVLLDDRSVVREWLVGYHTAADMEPLVERVLSAAGAGSGGPSPCTTWSGAGAPAARVRTSR